jgi:hypothetical protein
MQDYHSRYFNRPLDQESEVIDDWWAANRYKQLRRDGLITAPTDIVLQLELDGVQAKERGSHTSNPVILYLLNLPPELRTREDNLLLSMHIPGPRKHGDLDSFLRPLINELLELEAGIDMTDSYRGCVFTLRAHLVLVVGQLHPNLIILLYLF